jgi:chorismate mutase/prephenate dehydratase
MDLQECRRQIDEIDTELLGLFEKRMKIAEDVARYKIATGKKVLDPVREQEKLKAFQEMAHGEFNTLGAKEILQQIMATSRKRQYQLLTESGAEESHQFRMIDELPLEDVTVVFQGVEGAYSYAAMRAYFHENIESFHVKTWKDAMEAVSSGRADYAVLPIENSTAGIVADIYDLLMEYELCIVGEQIIRVDHVLLGLPEASLSDIRTVYSHPQGLAQCKKFLEGYPSWKSIKVENTAGAAKSISEDADPSCAAIASREAGRLYGLKVLAENICHNGANSTRFIIVGKEPVYQKNSHKVSVCVELPHETGTLYNMLSHMIYNGLNMTKIESRPIPGKTWEYRFFVDFEGNLSDSAVTCALRGLESESIRMRILGNYELQEEE